MKKIIVFVTLACFLFMSAFVSVPADSALSELQTKNIVEGFDDGGLHPEGILTRAQFAKILLNAFPDVVTTEVLYSFDDLDESHWSFNYIQKAVNAGWLKGYPDGTVRPDNAIKFEEAVAVVCRVLDLDTYFASYPDGYVSQAIEHSVTDGVNALIGEEINREEAAKLIINALNYNDSQFEDDDYGYFAYGGGSISAAAPNVAGDRKMAESNSESNDYGYWAEPGDAFLPPQLLK